MSADDADFNARIMRALDAATAKLEAVERERSEPIAIVGIGCRFPGGADSPEAFWQLLSEGHDAVGELPTDRAALNREGADKWPRLGGYLRDIDRFDADLFEISPREAESLDPQQRLLLETAWEALERGGLTRARARGSRIGVFIGITNCDYGRLIGRSADGPDAYFITGNTLNAAAGRIAYYLGLRGPALAVDTACSSSLVATHLAVQALRARECDAALVGGVNLILAPEGLVGLSQAGVLAVDGRCKTFDASADGMGRAEGCGVVLLKRLSDAERDGDDIWAQLLGSATNQDGASSGLTVPSGPAQEDVIRRALANARVAPGEIDYIEAHGTGTPLGDPIEVNAIAGVFTADRSAGDRLLVGSVKANIAHAESAAGIAGLIKLALCLRHRTIPPQPHFRHPSPHIDWDRLPIEIPTREIPWPTRGKRALAGISGFGFSGTNAHVVLGAAPSQAAAAPAPSDSDPELLVLSGLDAGALNAAIGNYAALLQQRGGPGLADLCFSASTTRDHHAERLAIVATPADAAAELAAESGARGRARPGHRPSIAFLFAGQGAQYAAMGGRLLECEPVFRHAVETCRDIAGRKLFPMAPGEGSIDDTANAQPALFAIEYALARLWQSWGVEPSAVIGHSIGEYAAACIAGVLSVEDALTLAIERGRLMAGLAHHGGMAAVFGTPERVAAIAAEYPGELAVAAINAPGNLVLSGDRSVLADAVGRLRAEGLTCRPLEVSHAFHGPWMAPILDPFRTALSRVRFARPQIPFISTVTGARADAEVTDPEYWVRQIVEPVRFADGIAAMSAIGPEIFLEIGPHPTLAGHARAMAPAETAMIASLKRGEDDRTRMLQALGDMHVAGAPLDWAAVYRHRNLRRATLPTYPFQRKRYWFAQAETDDHDAEDGAALWQLRWVEQSLTTRDQSRAEWLVLADSSRVGEEFAALLRHRGEPVAVIERAHAQMLPETLREMLARRAAPALRVVHLWSLDAAAYDLEPGRDEHAWRDALQYGCGVALDILNAAAQPVARRVRLWLVTRGAQAIGQESVAVTQAPLWGLGRTALLEYPELVAGMIDLDPAASLDARALLDEIASENDERQVAYRHNRRLVARLRRATQALSPTPGIAADGSYLVTGGLGGLGLGVAEWLTANRARHIVLAGRSAPSPEVRGRIDAMIRAGADIRVVAADIADQAQAAQAVAAAEQAGRLRGVMHAAGVLDDGMLLRQNIDRFTTVMAGKVLGAMHLDRLTRGRDLDFFVLFSSASATLGSPGQANYAAANATLDALAAERRRCGEAAISIAWGPWAETGMAARLRQAQRATLDAGPLTPLPVAQAIRLLGRLLQTPAAQIAAMRFDPGRLTSQRHAALSPLITGLLSATAPTGPAIATAPIPMPTDRAGVIAYLERCSRALLRLRHDQVLHIATPLQEQGFDSIMAMELRNRIAHELGEDVPIQRLIDGSTIEGLADLLHTRLALARAAAPVAEDDAELEELVL